jgi:nicotinic acid mononucleotide adenylyltransferase
MVPSGDLYQKIGLAPSKHRLAMCKFFAEDSGSLIFVIMYNCKDWLEVSQWEAYQTSFVLPYEVVNHVASIIEWPKVEVMFVCGADLLVRMRGYFGSLLKYGTSMIAVTID